MLDIKDMYYLLLLIWYFNFSDEAEAAGVDGENVEILNADEAGDGDGAGKSRKERVTTPYMTKYERARVLGTRALQVRTFLTAHTKLTRYL